MHIIQEKISDSIATKKNADQILAQAQIDFHNNKFEESIAEAENAKKIYMEINYSAGIMNSTALIKNNEEQKKKLAEQGNMNMLIIIGAIVAAIVLVVAGSWVNRVQKAKKEKEKLAIEKRSLEEAMKNRKKRRGWQRKQNFANSKKSVKGLKR